METRVTPLMPAQVTRVAAISSPAVTFMATNLVDQTLAGVFTFHCAHFTAKAYMAYLHTFHPYTSPLGTVIGEGKPLLIEMF